MRRFGGTRWPFPLPAATTSHYISSHDAGVVVVKSFDSDSAPLVWTHQECVHTGITSGIAEGGIREATFGYLSLVVFGAGTCIDQCFVGFTCETFCNKEKKKNHTKFKI